MTLGRDREYSKPSALPEWMKSFAEAELKREAKGENPFQEICNIFQTNKALSAISEKVSELKLRIGLDKLEADVDTGLVKAASINVMKIRAQAVRQLVSLASKFETEGNLQAAQVIDGMIARISKIAEETLDKENQQAEKEVPSELEEHPKLKTFIDNVCLSRGGHVSVPAVLKMIRDERPESVEVNDTLIDYIRRKLSEEKQEVSDGGDDVAGLNVGTSVSQQDRDDNNRMFETLDRTAA